MSKKNNYRYVAYDAANGDYEEFETLKEAEDWLKKDDCEGISDEACCGQNYIAEIQYRSVFTKTDEKSNYHAHTDECPEDCDEEEWPYSDDFDYIGNHWYEKIERDEEIMELNKFKDKDILVSDSEGVIAILKGAYNNGAFRDYAWLGCTSGVLDIRAIGVWDGITDWRLATAKEKAKFKTEIDIRREKAERELEVIAELQKIIQ